MKRLSMTFALCAVLLAGACTNDEGTAAAGSASVSQKQADLSAEELGKLGAEIRKNPDDAKRLLSERGLNEQSFETAVRKVSEDPAASKRYADAYKKAGA